MKEKRLYWKVWSFFMILSILFIIIVNLHLTGGDMTTEIGATWKTQELALFLLSFNIFFIVLLSPFIMPENKPKNPGVIV